jgi:hypothetical protein
VRDSRSSPDGPHGRCGGCASVLPPHSTVPRKVAGDADAKRSPRRTPADGGTRLTQTSCEAEHGRQPAPQPLRRERRKGQRVLASRVVSRAGVQPTRTGGIACRLSRPFVATGRFRPWRLPACFRTPSVAVVRGKRGAGLNGRNGRRRCCWKRIRTLYETCVRFGPAFQKRKAGVDPRQRLRRWTQIGKAVSCRK